MEERSNYDLGQVILVDNQKEYVIIKKIDNKVVLLSCEEPINILIGEINDKILHIITNREEVEKMLSYI